MSEGIRDVTFGVIFWVPVLAMGLKRCTEDRGEARARARARARLRAILLARVELAERVIVGAGLLKR